MANINKYSIRSITTFDQRGEEEMRLTKEQDLTREAMNITAYLVFKLCIVSSLILILLRHFVLYQPNETMWWVLLSIIVIYVFKVPLWTDIPINTQRGKKE